MKKLIHHVLIKEEYRKIDMLNVIITNAQYLRDLNKRFFRYDKTTNVISFNLGDTGEIYISADAVEVEYDLYYYLVHGLLHIIGYDHRSKDTESIMDKKCKKYVDKICS